MKENNIGLLFTIHIKMDITQRLEVREQKDGFLLKKKENIGVSSIKVKVFVYSPHSGVSGLGRV